MNALLGWLYGLALLVLVLALCLQGVLTARVRRLFARTPLIYSQLPLPPGIDLRAVLENPRLFYFTLAATGTVLRILIGVVVFLGFDLWAPIREPVLEAVVVLVVLVGAEAVSRSSRIRDNAPIGRRSARTMQLIGHAVRLLPGGSEPGANDADEIAGDVVATVDGQEMFDPIAKRFLGGFLRLKRTTVQQAMTPRDRIVTVNQDWSLSRAARVRADQPFARIPVVGKDGEITGVVHSKDILLLLHSSQSGTFVKSITREVDYVPATQRLDSLLRKFQTSRVHLAVVRDEYGRAVGLITMDDILRRALARETVA